MNDKLKLVSINGKGERNKYKEALRVLKKELGDFIEMQEMASEARYAKFNALKKAGFSEQQALELCKSITV